MKHSPDDDPVERWLKTQSAEAIPDAGFTDRVMENLPKRRERTITWQRAAVVVGILVAAASALPGLIRLINASESVLAQTPTASSVESLTWTISSLMTIACVGLVWYCQAQLQFAFRTLGSTWRMASHSFGP